MAENDRPRALQDWEDARASACRLAPAAACCPDCATIQESGQARSPVIRTPRRLLWFELAALPRCGKRARWAWGFLLLCSPQRRGNDPSIDCLLKGRLRAHRENRGRVLSVQCAATPRTPVKTVRTSRKLFHENFASARRPGRQVQNIGTPDWLVQRLFPRLVLNFGDKAAKILLFGCFPTDRCNPPRTLPP